MTHQAHSGLCRYFIAICLLAAPSLSLAAEDFYAGKQIRLLVGTDVQGTYDTHARTLSRHMGKHIPGSPTFIVQNVPGAGGIKMANFMFTAPGDGLMFGLGSTTTPTAPLTSPDEAKYDTKKFSWIGSGTREVYVGYFWHTVPVKGLEESKATEVLMGGSAVGTFSVNTVLIANAVFGMKLKPIIGYKSSAETKMAIERGEAQGVMGTNWNSLRRETDWLTNKKIRLVVQYGLERDEQFPGVPLFVDFAKNEADLQLAKFWVSNLQHGKPYFAPPGVPEDRLAILRRAFDQTLKDPDFQKELIAAGENTWGPLTGPELARVAAEEASTSPAVVRRISDIVKKYLEGNR